jgi:hypothetical protein
MQQYKDSTGIGAYSYLSHGDEARKTSYQKRFRHYYDPNYFSPTQMSWEYLWS